jgi:hypothetical protein
MAKRPEDMTEEELYAAIWFYEGLQRRLVLFIAPFVPIMRIFYGTLWHVFQGLALGALWLRDYCSKAMALAGLVEELRPLTRRQ